MITKYENTTRHVGDLWEMRYEIPGGTYLYRLLIVTENTKLSTYFSIAYESPGANSTSPIISYSNRTIDSSEEYTFTYMGNVKTHPQYFL